MHACTSSASCKSTCPESMPLNVKDSPHCRSWSGRYVQRWRRPSRRPGTIRWRPPRHRTMTSAAALMWRCAAPPRMRAWPRCRASPWRAPSPARRKLPLVYLKLPGSFLHAVLRNFAGMHVQLSGRKEMCCKRDFSGGSCKQIVCLARSVDEEFCKQQRS